MAHRSCDKGVSTTSPLMYVTVELEGGKQPYRAMLDTGAMVAVAKASMIPPQLREALGKTRLQGPFGECVDAELSTLHVKLQPAAWYRNAIYPSGVCFNLCAGIQRV